VAGPGLGARAGFAARRLAADPVGLVFAARDPAADLAGLPELDVGGLRDDDARALLEAALGGPLDAQVRDLIIAGKAPNRRPGGRAQITSICTVRSGTANERETRAERRI
jgi:hypothetical protein